MTALALMMGCIDGADLMMGGMVLSNGESTYGAEHLHLTRYNNKLFALGVLSEKAYRRYP